MTKKINLTVKANLDLEEHLLYLAQNNSDAALRFFESARETFAQLAKNPSMGRLYPVSNLKLSGLRKWSVKGFEKYLIFYLIEDDTIKILRIIHAARNILAILEQEENE
jgi:toxin ParE1/3/4